MPFNLTETQSALLREWRKQWNMAETAMKIAEKVDEEFQSPSVNELRYSGRQVVDFIGLIEVPDAMKPADDCLRAAIHACHCARHDATDYASSIISTRMELARGQFGASAIIKVFPDYVELVKILVDVKKLIAQSRGNREMRERFYCEVEDEHLPRMIDLFDKFRVVESELEDGRIWRMFEEFGVRWGWMAGIAVGVGGVAVALLK